MVVIDSFEWATKSLKNIVIALQVNDTGEILCSIMYLAPIHSENNVAAREPNISCRWFLKRKNRDQNQCLGKGLANIEAGYFKIVVVARINSTTDFKGGGKYTETEKGRVCRWIW